MFTNNFDLTDFVNTEVNKTAFVFATGPSLGDALPFFLDEPTSNKILISCNDIDIFTDLIPDYWVFANSIQTIASMIERFAKFPNSVVVYADSVDTTPNEWVKQNLLTNKFISYDQRHFNNQKCPHCPNGCANFIENRFTIQELLSKFTKTDFLYSPGDTVAVHMLALAIILGCKKIYLAGVDLDYSKGYYGSNMINNDSFGFFISNILRDFKIINECAKSVGVEIYCYSTNTDLLNIFNN
jgi:hypothetical protein